MRGATSGSSIPIRRPVDARVRKARKSGEAPPGSLYSIRIREIWGFLTRQSLSFWFLNGYLFFEYVRPQSIYREMDVLPWSWSFIVLALVTFLFERSRLRPLYAADQMLMLFSGMILVSSFSAVWPTESYNQLSLFFGWVLIYFLITNVVNSEQRFLIFMLGFLLYSTKMSQHGVQTYAGRGGGFASWGATGGPGWFRNSGEFGIQMCIFFPLSVYFFNSLRPYWSKWKLLIFLFMPLSALISIVASSSRGAVVGLAPVILWMLLKSTKRIQGLTLAAILAVGVWFILPAEQKERFSSMGEDDTSQSRLVYWTRGMEMMREHPVTGIGYKNWLRYSRVNYEPLYGKGGNPIVQLPHNIFVEAGAELGYTGLFIFFGLIGMTLYTNYRTRKIAKRLRDRGVFGAAMAHGLDAAMIGYLASGMFVTVLYYPFFWINYAMTVALHHSVVREAARVTVPRPMRTATPVQLGYGRA